MSKLKLLTTFDKMITGFFVIVICLLLFLSVVSYGQNVGINNPAPDVSALLDLTSTGKGLLVPRMSTAQRTAIASPAEALLVYDLDLDEFLFYNGTTWKNLFTEKSAWSLTGNTGTSASTNYIGTNDNTPLNFRVNNIKAGKIDHIKQNVFFGRAAGAACLAGQWNVFIGDSAGAKNNSNANTYIGYWSGKNDISFENTFVGYNSGRSNTAGYENTFTGAYAGYMNINGHNNTTSGYGAGGDLTSGNYNSMFGSHAGTFLTTGSENCFFGYYSGGNAWFDNTGSSNSTYGYLAGSGISTGSSNCFFGHLSGDNNTTGNQNTFLGKNAGALNDTGNNNTCVGAASSVGSNNLSNATAIGYNASVAASNSMVLGGTGADAVKVGIGVNAPTAELEINGYTKLGSSAPAIKVLKLTGTTAATQGASVTVNPGISNAKILSVDVLLEYNTGFFIPENYSHIAGYEYNFNTGPGFIRILNSTANSVNILSKPFKVLVTYEL